MNQDYWLEEFLSTPRDFVDKFFNQGKYYQKIRSWDKSNKKRKHPRSCYIFTLDEEDAKRNATFSTFEIGIKEHMLWRGYLTKFAGLLPMNILKGNLIKLAGVQMEENVFMAPEVTFDPVLAGWTRFRKGCSVGWGARFFNHLFEERGKIIVGYIDVGEEVSIGGFVSVSPGVTIGKRVNIGAEVKLGPGVFIGDDAKIGAGSLICPFVHVGKDAEVAMGSVVTQSIKSGEKVQGNPAKVVIENINKDKKPKLDLIVNPKLEKDNQII